MQVVDLPFKDGDANISLSGGTVTINVVENSAAIQGGAKITIPLNVLIDAFAAKANNPFVTTILKLVEAMIAGVQ